MNFFQAHFHTTVAAVSLALPWETNLFLFLGGCWMLQARIHAQDSCSPGADAAPTMSISSPTWGSNQVKVPVREEGTITVIKQVNSE